MPGRYLEMTWQADPTVYAPARLRRACRYRAFLSEPVKDLDIRVRAEVAGLGSEAEAAVGALNASARPALAPLARLQLRPESIASSKVEGCGWACGSWPGRRPGSSRAATRVRWRSR